MLQPSRSQCTAPCAVFFDASDTTAASTLRPFHELDYTWDFADPASSALPRVIDKFDHNRAKGPVSAHVFDPGYLKVGPNGENVAANVNQYGLYVGPALTYPVKVTVRDLNNDLASLTQNIVVQPFSGKIYFVNAVSGNDANSGLSETQAWKSFAQAFLPSNPVTAGDAVLFKRGQTFPFNAFVQAKSGVIYGAFGSGATPLIQNVGMNDQWSMALSLGGTTGTVLNDLHFDLAKQLYENPGAIVFDEGSHGLILRTRLENMAKTALVTNSGDPLRTQGVFLVDSTIKDALTAIYYERSMLVLLNSELSGFEEHIMYTGINKGVISGNHASKWDYSNMSKGVLRITGGFWEKYGVPSNDIVISDNFFEGRMRTDGRYNYAAVHFGPNIDPPMHKMENVIFERNHVAGAEMLVVINGGYSHLTIRNNFLELPPGAWAAIAVQNQNFSACTTPGSQDIDIAGNTITGESEGIGIQIAGHCGPYSNRDIRVRDNIITSQGRTAEGIRLAPEMVGQLVSSRNIFYFPNMPYPFHVNGDWHDFATWRNYSGQDGDSLLTNPMLVNLNGPDGIYRTADDDLTLQSISPAANRGAPLPLFDDFNGHARLDGNGAFLGGAPDIGAYECR